MHPCRLLRARLSRHPLALLLLSSPLAHAQPATDPTTRPTTPPATTIPADDAPPADLSAFAESLRARLDVPALALCATSAERELAWGVAGTRSLDDPAPVERADRFHLGSLTKSMTATLCAIYVERGLLTWDTTIAQADPALAEEIPQRARSITLRQLLGHRTGLPDDRAGGSMLLKFWSLTGPITDQRRQAARLILTNPDAGEPGERFAYANANYIVAGHLLETLTGEAWETLIDRELFKPLGMTTAGQGAPGAEPDEGPQPLGHGGPPTKRVPIKPGLAADNPPLLGPAGRVHCSVEDLARYARAHLAGLRGSDAGVLPHAAFVTLHDDPEGDGYALGWGVSGQGDDRRSTHAGSNTRWLALITVWPACDVAVVVTMNAYPDPARRIDALAETLHALDEAGLIQPPATTTPQAP